MSERSWKKLSKEKDWPVSAWNREREGAKKGEDDAEEATISSSD